MFSRYLARNLCGLALLTSLGAIAPTLPLQAQPSNQTNITSMTPQSLKGLLEDSGYRNISLEDDGLLVFKVQGITTVFGVAQDGQSALLRASWSTDNATLQEVNNWNATKLFSRAYLDEEGDPVIEMDLNVAGGISPEYVERFMDTSTLLIGRFRTEVVSN